jgi:hypothetical protein
MFAAPVVSVLLVIDDPDVVEAGRRFVDGGRDLLLGLDGATRARDRDGQVRKPVVIAAENRTVIAYDVIPEPKPPEAGGVGPPAVTVTVATGTDWALVAAMASDDLNADAAAALVTARGLEAAVAPLAQGSTGRSRIEWIVADPPKERKEVRHRTASRGDSQGEEN